MDSKSHMDQSDWLPFNLNLHLHRSRPLDEHHLLLLSLKNIHMAYSLFHLYLVHIA